MPGNSPFVLAAGGFVPRGDAGGGGSPPPPTPTGTLLNVQIFQAGGVYTPTVGATAVQYEAVGSGGGGGGTEATAAGECAVGGGGAAGAYISDYLDFGVQVTGGAVVIGAAGAGGVAGNNPGSAGADVTFTIQGVAYRAKGGGGGNGSARKSGAAAIGNDGGSVPAGSTAARIIVYGQGEVGVAGFTLHWGGGGGSTPLGGGAQRASNTAGLNAVGRGGGGSGADAGAAGVVARAGGNGLAGMVIIYEYS